MFANLGIEMLIYIGTNVDAAKELLAKSGLTILSAENLDDAAQKAVKCLS